MMHVVYIAIQLATMVYFFHLLRVAYNQGAEKTRQAWTDELVAIQDRASTKAKCDAVDVIREMQEEDGWSMRDQVVLKNVETRISESFLRNVKCSI